MIEALYADFPLLKESGVAYLDSAATAQKPAPVLKAMDDYQRLAYGPVPGGLYPLAGESQRIFDEARCSLSSFVGAQQTVFSSNATESINLACWGYAKEVLRPGDSIVLSPAEHHSNLVPWQQLAQKGGMNLRYLRLTDHGEIDLDDAYDALSDPRSRFLAVAHASNVLGTVNPVRELTEIAHQNSVQVLVDGTQAAPHMPVDFEQIGCEFYAWSGHKAYGPTGIGVLHTTLPLSDIQPTAQGGHMISSVSLEETVFASDHWRLEPGSPRLTEAVGLSEACRLLEQIGTSKVHEHGQQLVDYAMPLLEAEGAEVYGPNEGRVGLISFNIPGVHAHDVAEICARSGVCVKAGHHCAQPLHNQILGIPASVRASFALHTTSEDIDRLLDGLREVKRVFG